MEKNYKLKKGIHLFNLTYILYKKPIQELITDIERSLSKEILTTL